MGRIGASALERVIRQTQKGQHTLRQVWQGDRGICHLCRMYVLMSEASRDHVVPVADGGPDNLDNLRLAHKDCNVARAALTMAEVSAVIEEWHASHPGMTWTRRICVDILTLAQKPVTEPPTLIERSLDTAP